MADDSWLTPGQALYVFRRLVADGRISQAEVDRYLSQLAEEIRNLQARLSELWAAMPDLKVRGGRTSGAAAAYASRGQAATPEGPRSSCANRLGRTQAICANRSAQAPTKLADGSCEACCAGRYVGRLRQRAAGNLPAFQRLAKRKGFEAAIKALRRHLRE